ncbi:Hemolysin C [Pandoraea terrae]|uniref:Hemolysin C n=1 Tax=Pandoraea terrae TaxID=1537710 RepID=A0A5E4TTQ8_9BURK|nr:hemolysin family protein [Pandoraea terrae]VVD90981.1 Hemolysin C [Pandoraea terrae]
MENLILIAAAILLVVLNGFFVAAEFGLVKLRQTRVHVIARQRGWRGRILARVHGHLDTYLSACQLGITLASLGLGWIGEPAFARVLTPFFGWLGIASPELIHALAFFIAFFTISYLHIVIGELAPKSMALRMPEAISIWTAAPLYVFYWAMYPAIWILNKSANRVLHWIGLDVSHGPDAHYSADEIKLIMRRGASSEKLSPDDWNVVAYAIDFSDLQVSDLMRPMSEVAAFRRTATFAENMDTAYRHRYSRYPFYDADGETVLGVVHLKDLFLAEHHDEPIDDLGRMARPVERVVPDMPARELFRRFRRGAPHFAIVGWPGQKPIGFLTLDNLLSALVGKIRDEFRQTEDDWTRMEDGTLIGRGSLPILTLERALHIEIPSEHAESVGGLIMDALGYLPREGQCIEFDGFKVVVKKMQGPRIILVRIYPDGVDRPDSDAEAA